MVGESKLAADMCHVIGHESNDFLTVVVDALAKKSADLRLNAEFFGQFTRQTGFG
jgi:hypothetical protein